MIQKDDSLSLILYGVSVAVENFAEKIAISNCSLTYRQLLPLLILRYNKTLTQADIARKLCITPSALVRTLDKLHKDGYINKVNSLVHKRYNDITLTHTGSKIAEKLSKIFERELKRILSKSKKIKMSNFYDVLSETVELLNSKN